MILGNLSRGPWGFVACLTLVCGSAFETGPRASVCQPVHVVVDTTAADTFFIAFIGRGFGQVFVAPETLVSSITVWRPAYQPVAYGLGQLYITAVDSTGVPIPAEIILAGPVVVPPPGDSVHATAWRFALEPPFRLPEHGRYFFDIIEVSCGDAFGLLGSDRNPYPNGAAWKTSPVFDCSTPGPPRQTSADLDLVFDIEFCDETTGIRPKTWGALKLLYR